MSGFPYLIQQGSPFRDVFMRAAAQRDQGNASAATPDPTPTPTASVVEPVASAPPANAPASGARRGSTIAAYALATQGDGSLKQTMGG